MLKRTFFSPIALLGLEGEGAGTAGYQRVEITTGDQVWRRADQTGDDVIISITYLKSKKRNIVMILGRLTWSGAEEIEEER